METQIGSTGKPNLLFLRSTKPGQPPFLLRQLNEQVACLQQFFEVALVEQMGDYDELCERHQPDVALFESGIYVGPRSLTNTHTHPHVPKLGFLNADAFDPVRATFVADMASWGVDTWFSVSVSMAEYTPEIADRLFCWPNFVDPAVHRDYGMPKVVPVLLTGSQARHYPWRNRVNRVLAQHYPTLTMPHFGWADSAATRRMLMGVSYARLVSSAHFAPSCGSFTRDLVRKHLEIPAARTCLVTQPTEAVEAAGFEDMVNCVFADAGDVVDKVDALLADPVRLSAITDAGHDLVHGRHTMANRRQIRDWYDLWTASGGSDEDIVQEHAFAPLTPLRRPPVQARREGPIVVAPSEDRRLITAGWEEMASGRFASAQKSFARASNFHYMPEAEVGVCWAQLAQGQASSAGRTLQTLLDHCVSMHGSVEPDPVQWALRLRVMLCQGRLGGAAEEARRHPQLGHEELDRMRWAVAVLANQPRVASMVDASAPRPSVNPLPPLPWGAWVDELTGMLSRNGRPRLAAELREARGRPTPPARSSSTSSVPGAVPSESDPLRFVPPWSAVPRRIVLGRARRLSGRLRVVARRIVTAEWLDVVAEVAEREPVEQALFIGRSRFGLRAEGLRRALARNAGQPTVHFVSGRAARGRLDDQPSLVYIGPRVRMGREDAEWLDTARVVVVDHSDRPGISALLDRLVGDDFELVAAGEAPASYHVLRHRLPQDRWCELRNGVPVGRPGPRSRTLESGGAR